MRLTVSRKHLANNRSVKCESGARCISDGFSLLEVLIWLGLVALIATLTTTSFLPSLQRQRLRSAQLQLTHILTFARRYAVINRVPVYACPALTTPQRACSQSNRWHQGAYVFVDLNRSKTLDQHDRLLAHMRVQSHVSIVSGRNGAITFNQRARNDFGNTRWSLNSHSASAAHPSEIVVFLSNSGRIRVHNAKR